MKDDVVKKVAGELGDRMNAMQDEAIKQALAPKWSLQVFQVKDLKEYAKNPRKLSKNDYEQLSTSISKFGVIDRPVCLKNCQLIGGHQRKKILQKLGVKEIECMVPDRDLDEKEIEELNVRLNKNQGEWDFDILGNQFDAMELITWGFEPTELLGIEKLEDTDIEEEKPDRLKTCPHCGKEI